MQHGYYWETGRYEVNTIPMGSPLQRHENIRGLDSFGPGNIFSPVKQQAITSANIGLLPILMRGIKPRSNFN